jgi:hypothetical protein
MARSRVIKPEFWSDEKLARVSRESRLTFAGLWTTSDDYGVTKAHPAWIKSQLFPYDDDLETEQVSRWLEDLERLGFVLPFEANGEKFYLIRHFEKHQKVDKPSKARNPEPPPDINTRESVASVSRESSDETETETETETTPPNPPRGGGGVSGYKFPEWLNLDLWADFRRMRSRIKKPITTRRTIDGLLNQLKTLMDKGCNQDEIIQASIDHCWQDFYAPKKESSARPTAREPTCRSCGMQASNIIPGNPCPFCEKTA